MGRLIALDFGTRRVGIAHSDDMKIIASPLTTLSPEETPAFLAQYHRDNGIETIVVGKPAHLHSAQAHVDVENDIKAFIACLEKALPGGIRGRFFCTAGITMGRLFADLALHFPCFSHFLFT